MYAIAAGLKQVALTMYGIEKRDLSKLLAILDFSGVPEFWKKGAFDNFEIRLFSRNQMELTEVLADEVKLIVTEK